VSVLQLMYRFVPLKLCVEVHWIWQELYFLRASTCARKLEVSVSVRDWGSQRGGGRIFTPSEILRYAVEKI
jgi:hypothetical protein